MAGASRLRLALASLAFAVLAFAASSRPRCYRIRKSPGLEGTGASIGKLNEIGTDRTPVSFIKLPQPHL